MTDQTPSTKRSRAKNVTWTLGIGLASFVAIDLILLFLLTQATNNSALYESYYGYLVAMNVGAASIAPWSWYVTTSWQNSSPNF